MLPCAMGTPEEDCTTTVMIAPEKYTGAIDSAARNWPLASGVRGRRLRSTVGKSWENVAYKTA